ncbi:hypothetical protein DFR58_103155 [Anaerobacterium chartisolvens]|uniref:Uncharacterized protein n=1 Tax=Anaerobacterium chartisolvens TaxID=1297424 RepID=A0A369BCX8_9FIRM|nr:hypothetical protein [Anaerobacterium chartisolvens]RCX19410.1 hypothetical protein DFR58_103155 [Anaerobacterium chartisolvens]
MWKKPSMEKPSFQKVNLEELSVKESSETNGGAVGVSEAIINLPIILPIKPPIILSGIIAYPYPLVKSQVK